MRLRTLLLALTVLPLPVWALSPDELRTDAPSVYTVEKGDTLWDIAATFLDDPWRWEELWDRNPYISNPDLIYPGDRLVLRVVDGEARLTRQRVERLSPEAEEQPVERLEAISTVDPSVVVPFLGRYGIVDPETEPADLGGYLVAGENERVMYATGDRVFTRLKEPEELEDPTARDWHSYDEPEALRDPDSGAHLGYLLRHTGTLSLEGPAEDGLFESRVERTFAPVEAGDHLYPADGDYEARFTPEAAPDVEGRVLRHVEEESLVGQGQIVVLNLGSRDGLEKGHVLQVLGSSQTVDDPQRFGSAELPGRDKGTLLVFQVGQRLSFAMIMENSRAIAAKDRVVSPER
ncbi:MAG: LysM peptidoglycan-binding domain-containing protein [Thiohalorhabdus sp.]|uniref:LysM peptidoglycan-binding domain-containing protein n=1 Tax=Thiohalorhabdus sp. TaxID=3094134 RepID=UPI0039806E0F